MDILKKILYIYIFSLLDHSYSNIYNHVDKIVEVLLALEIQKYLILEL